MEFDGDPRVWNDLLRPVLGGPEAPSEAAPPASDAATTTTATPASATTPAASTQAAQPQAAQPQVATPAAAPAPEQAPPAAAIEPTSDPRELYRRLVESGGRRGEKDAIVAAVWFVGGSDGDATPEEVQQHLVKHGAFADARVKPVMLKHVSRTRLLEKTERKGALKLTEKGRKYVRERLVGS